ncbi:hypothetical protein O0555_04185 [Brevibacillus laterosporus]|uniref:hypothetical protein n=1 Tax=Brevibacillus laterosporus TaxID=1465 RepID=UPI0018CFEE10|nr:hypothetical protein [Brevibacillus laterosporus]MBG9796245.1 hypothetical protein [Brevibacillus laterosporus]MCR8936552.1 hypothetical protein [Brevibacillus laterosporus]MCZ0839191.1 hypothetical protein [Brevibacillus laterosporus]MCZ0846121.1 hypothetical protein [Brevibacillus laterosporus]MED1910861.1 hypothetical protein [Brevibacillus laterosporus]
MAADPCDMYGKKHKMWAKGVVHIRDTKTEDLIDSWWSIFYCKCGSYFACNGRPAIDGPIGDYLTEDRMDRMNITRSAGTWAGVIYTKESRIRNTDDTTRSDMRFYQE